MKRKLFNILYFFVAFFCLLCITSCGKEEDNNAIISRTGGDTVNASDFIGDWMFFEESGGECYVNYLYFDSDATCQIALLWVEDSASFTGLDDTEYVKICEGVWNYEEGVLSIGLRELGADDDYEFQPFNLLSMSSQSMTFETEKEDRFTIKRVK